MPDAQEQLNNLNQMPPHTMSAEQSYADQPSNFALSLGHWIDQHRDITSKNPVGYTAYQIARSAIACVPYGFSMAGTWLGFQNLHEAGAKMAGVDVAKIVDKSALITDAKKGFKGKFGYRMAQFTGPNPVRVATMIATSFSLYRGTSKLGKWTNDYLFDKDDTEQQTVEKIKDYPSVLWGKIGEVAPAEFNSTPVSAIVLGFLVAAFSPPAHLGKAFTENVAMKGQGFAKRHEHFWKEMIRNPNAKFFEQTAINTIAYSLFFELGDRRFKDKQISRDLWAGKSHSIGSGSKSNPSLVTEDMDNDENIEAIKNESHANDKLSILTSEPSAVRFALRRVLPTAVGITAYTAYKMRGAPLMVGKFTEGFKTAKDIPIQAWREGAATSLFFVVPWVTDKYAPVFDKFVNGLEDMVSGKKPKDAQEFAPQEQKHIDHKLQDLQQRLDKKEMEKDGVAAASR